MNIHANKFFLCIMIFFLPWLFIYSQNKKFTVIIDAGHGGKDYGAWGFGIYEKNITLSITKKLGAYIKKYIKDVKIIYTRTTDIFITLINRAKIANKNHANLFISIHCNATNNITKIEGTETYVLGIQKDINKIANSIIHFESHFKKNYKFFNIHSPKLIIGVTLTKNTFLKNSIEFAKKVEKQFILLGRHSRGVKQAEFLVIRETAMPAVLIETGFITNRKEGYYLSNVHGQTNIAKAIYKAFLEFKLDYDSKYY